MVYSLSLNTIEIIIHSILKLIKLKALFDFEICDFDPAGQRKRRADCQRERK